VSNERKPISSVVAVFVTVALGAVMVYLGFLLVATSLATFEADGPVVAAVGLGAIGVALVVLPIMVLLSQVRALLAHRSK